MLSPSSATIDLGDKPAEYLRVPSVCAYLVLSQDEPKVWAWVRGDGGFDAAPKVIKGKDAMVRISALSLELPLAEIYKDFPETT